MYHGSNGHYDILHYKNTKDDACTSTGVLHIVYIFATYEHYYTFGRGMKCIIIRMFNASNGNDILSTIEIGEMLFFLPRSIYDEWHPRVGGPAV